MNLILIGVTIYIVLFILIIWYIVVFNKLKRYSIKTNEALSDIDVALTKRYEVLTKMVEVVKGYTKHEKEVLFTVTNLRKDMTIKELNEANSSIDENFKKIDLTVENYPDIKANENFKILQKSVIDTEEHLQAARRFYNSSVFEYNQLVETFPSLIVARMNGNVVKEFFKAEEEKKENVKVEV